MVSSTVKTGWREQVRERKKKKTEATRIIFAQLCSVLTFLKKGSTRKQIEIRF